MMLAPQYSLRRLIGWVTLSGCVCLIVAAAARGQMWAAAVSIGLFELIVMFALYGLAFVVIRGLSVLRQRRKQSP
jgi:hypothetical protein